MTIDRNFDISKLSKKVADHILLMEDRVEHLQGQLDAIQDGDGRIWWSILEEKHGIPEHATITFQIFEYPDARFDVRLTEQGEVYVYTPNHRGLIVFPCTNNVVKIGMR